MQLDMQVESCPAVMMLALLFVILTLDFLPPRRPSFFCSLSDSSGPSPSDIAAPTWSNDYNFLALTQGLPDASKPAYANYTERLLVGYRYYEAD